MKLLAPYRPLFKKNPKNRYYLVTGGRGSAKSFHVSLLLLNLTYQQGHIILFTRWTMTSAHISIMPEFIEKIELLNAEKDFKISQKEIVNLKTGSRIVFRGIKTSQGTATANLKSIQGVTTWVLDEAEELTEQDIFDRIDLSIRAKDKPNRVILVMNPSYKSHWIYKTFIEAKRNDCEYIHTSYNDNIENLSQSFINQAEQTKKQNIERFNHLFMGKWLEDAEGILWNRNIIERSRVTSKPENMRVCIAIDPATTKDTNSDETGIVAVGKAEGKYYVLSDKSGKYSPNEWSKVASDLFNEYKADFYVAEKNQGGDMVETVIRQNDKRNRVKLVTATKGKYLRAEPVYQLYENFKVHHVGHLPILERQMITFNPEENKKSPDRVDALVYGVTYLNNDKGKLLFVNM